MEDLFSTNISTHHHHIHYRVVFDDEKYTFISEAEDVEYPKFSLVREHDEWHDQELLPPDLKKQAVNALEKYLLQQH